MYNYVKQIKAVKPHTGEVATRERIIKVVAVSLLVVALEYVPCKQSIK